MTAMTETPSPVETPSAATLRPEEVRRRCDPAGLALTPAADLPDVAEVLGQERALEALRLGMGLRRDGFNVFAVGPSGVGKRTVVLRLLREKAAEEATPPDWCYVHDFAEPHRPKSLRLPPGTAGPLARDMDRLGTELKVALPAAFQSEDYRARKKLLDEKLKERQEQAFAEIEKRAAEHEITLIRTPLGLALAPTRNGDVLEPDDFHKLPEPEQERRRTALAELQDQLRSTVASLPRWEREHREKVRELEREVVAFSVAHLIDDLRTRYAALPGVLEHLTAVQNDLQENAEDFLPGPDGELSDLLGRRAGREDHHYQKYKVNVLVDHSGTKGAPVVEEDHPSHGNLLGRVEHRSEMGTLVTDFQLVKAGALHRASGGYLVLDARKVLMQPFAWEELKRALRTRQLRMESVAQLLGLVSTVSLEPEPIPLDVRVVLIGDRLLYYLLAAYDPDFPELFKVLADFEDDLDRTPEGEALYARFAATLARNEGLLPLDAGAAARAVEYASRRAGDAERLSTHAESLLDLLREADHRARGLGRAAILAEDVREAELAATRRADRIHERTVEEIRRGTLRIETEGTRVGQVNGLSVLQLGTYAFGRPSRITARVRMGRGRVLDIEREVALGGPIHSKGVLILGGFLAARYVPERPLSLSASLVFEQSYSGVEGDSASAAELMALLSALAEAPLKQALAVTGSVDQQGQIQAVGGLNEKIEGFYDVCRARGLTGDQGVLIPAANVKHLMLRDDVVEAVANGRFHVYPMDTVDQALGLLTGQPAGERYGHGPFPEGTLNRRIEERLTEFAERARIHAADQGS